MYLTVMLDIYLSGVPIYLHTRALAYVRGVTTVHASRILTFNVSRLLTSPLTKDKSGFGLAQG